MIERFNVLENFSILKALSIGYWSNYIMVVTHQIHDFFLADLLSAHPFQVENPAESNISNSLLMRIIASGWKDENLLWSASLQLRQHAVWMKIHSIESPYYSSL